MTEIVANSVLPAKRELIHLTTSDGENLIGELASPIDGKAIATIITVHPLPTHGGNTDSHLYRKMSWRLPAQAGFNILRFNSKEASNKLEKLLLSAIANWQAKNAEASLEDAYKREALKHTKLFKHIVVKDVKVIE